MESVTAVKPTATHPSSCEGKFATYHDEDYLNVNDMKWLHHFHPIVYNAYVRIRIHQLCNYTNDVLDGECVTFDKNKMEISEYVNGKLVKIIWRRELRLVLSQPLLLKID